MFFSISPYRSALSSSSSLPKTRFVDRCRLSNQKVTTPQCATPAFWRLDPFHIHNLFAKVLMGDLVSVIDSKRWPEMGSNRRRRAAARRKELAIRTALGGGWLRLMRERLLECLLLSAAGGALGLLLAFAALHWLTLTRHDMSRVESIHIDGVVAAFTVGVIVLCALFSGLIAAFSASDKRILGALHEASRSVSGGSARATLRKVLLTLEVGLTVILLIGAGLLLKSYERLRSADMGCLTQDVITMHLGIPDARYATPAKRANFYDTLL